ncbi:MAG: FkbM family methyltransferase [Verrucomicrobia bacterium]|nr:FkbM family methyltransferase [Verrucomicrobiota bacterium]
MKTALIITDRNNPKIEVVRLLLTDRGITDVTVLAADESGTRFSPLSSEPPGSAAESLKGLPDVDLALMPAGVTQPANPLMLCESARLAAMLRLAANGTRILVVGDPTAELARTARALGLGVAKDFAGMEAGLDQIVTPARNAKTQAPPSLWAAQLDVGPAWEWFKSSLQGDEVVDDPYEKRLGAALDRLTPFVDADAPKDVHWEFVPQIQTLSRLRTSGYKPDFVVDVGASTGIWSHYASKVFKDAKYYLVEPLLDIYCRHQGAIYRMHPEFIPIKCAAGAVAETKNFHVSHDLYGSSFFEDESFADGRAYEDVEVSVRTLDEIAETEGIAGRGLVKIDTQFSEHLVIGGAARFLEQVDFILVEVSLFRLSPECRIFPEIVEQLRACGFYYYDEAGGWRDPSTGQLLQQDAVFARGDRLRI